MKQVFLLNTFLYLERVLKFMAQKKIIRDESKKNIDMKGQGTQYFGVIFKKDVARGVNL